MPIYEYVCLDCKKKFSEVKPISAYNPKKVKCPKCLRTWDYKNKRLKVPPKYKYCRECDKVRADTGKALYWGRLERGRE